MATTTAFGSLSVPAPDDTMEMSSPANRNIDDDIDIDFEDYQGGVQLIDDERMHEDDPTRPTTATDDMMQDDLLPGEQPQIEEESMRDDTSQAQEVQQLEDEELIDYGEDEFQDPVDDTVIPPPEVPAEVDEIGFVQLGEDASDVVESAPVEIPGVTLQQDDVPTAAQQIEEPPSVAEDSLAFEAHPEDDAEPEESRLLVNESEAHEATAQPVPNSQSDQPLHAEDDLQFPPPLDTAVSTSTDTPGTPTDTGLHPMTIRYGDKFLPLFKSKRQPHGLLKNDNLASLSLAELITQCRQRLVLKIGLNVPEDQELVLSFEHMGLMLVEDCHAAFESSLHDVLEVYLQLHENDGAEDVPPLAMSLTTQLKFQSSFAILKQAAAGGQGMSSFHISHSTDEQEDYYQGQYNTGDSRPHGEHDAPDEFETREYGENTYGDGPQPDHGGQYQDQYEHTGEQGEEGYEDYYQEDDYQEHTGEEEFYIPEQDEATAQLDELEAAQAYEEEPLDNALENQKVAADELSAAEHQAASAVSSATAQGDSANNSAGEYDDDLIDWDDDNLTATPPEHDADPHEDFSTFLTEYEDDTAKDGKLEGDGADAQRHSGLDENNVPGLLPDDPPASARLQSGPRDHPQEDDAQVEEHSYQAGEQEGDYTFDQADAYDEQQQQYHPDYQPGEDDEQFHTAHDFLNTDQFEHGPEHDVYAGQDNSLDDTIGTVIHHESAEHQEYDDQEDFNDEIGYDDEDGGDLQNGGTAAVSGSPTGKRSFDELEEFDDEDDREVKKVRAS